MTAKLALDLSSDAPAGLHFRVDAQAYRRRAEEEEEEEEEEEFSVGRVLVYNNLLALRLCSSRFSRARPVCTCWQKGGRKEVGVDV